MAREQGAITELDSIEADNTVNSTASAVSSEVNRRRCVFIFRVLILLSPCFLSLELTVVFFTIFRPYALVSSINTVLLSP